MKTGKKSILFGVHHFIWHPITVFFAWVHLYGRPSWREFVCIIIHDLGYWNCEKMDDERGEEHPRWAANKAMKWFGPEYYCLCLYHSRHYAKRHNQRPSRLCWADKLSVLYDPMWLYLTRAKLSGELKGYRGGGQYPAMGTNKGWFLWLRGAMKTLASTKNPESIPYLEKSTTTVRFGGDCGFSTSHYWDASKANDQIAE